MSDDKTKIRSKDFTEEEADFYLDNQADQLDCICNILEMSGIDSIYFLRWFANLKEKQLHEHFDKQQRATALMQITPNWTPKDQRH